jgi:hypothetical protein
LPPAGPPGATGPGDAYSGATWVSLVWAACARPPRPRFPLGLGPLLGQGLAPVRAATPPHLLCRSRRRRRAAPARYSEAGSTPSSSRRWAAGGRAGWAGVQEGGGEERRDRRRQKERGESKRGGAHGRAALRTRAPRTAPAPSLAQAQRRRQQLVRSRCGRLDAGEGARGGGRGSAGGMRLQPPPPTTPILLLLSSFNASRQLLPPFPSLSSCFSSSPYVRELYPYPNLHPSSHSACQTDSRELHGGGVLLSQGTPICFTMIPVSDDSL